MATLRRVGAVSKQLGVNAQTLYFYERIGLIPPVQRSTAGYRLFSEQDIARLSFILRVKALGLALDEIKDLLILQAGQSLTCEVMHHRLVTKVKQLDEQIHQLQALRDELIPLVEQCQTNLNRVTPTQECAVVKEITHETQNSVVG